MKLRRNDIDVHDCQLYVDEIEHSLHNITLKQRMQGETLQKIADDLDVARETIRGYEQLALDEIATIKLRKQTHAQPNMKATTFVQLYVQPKHLQVRIYWTLKTYYPGCTIEELYRNLKQFSSNRNIGVKSVNAIRTVYNDIFK